MSELDLSRCPICQTSRKLLRQTRQAQGQNFIWFECPECASALMWLGGDRWIYQKVGRTDRQYLLKRPLTTVELQALSAATTQPIVAQDYAFTREPPSDTYSRLEDENIDASKGMESQPIPLPIATEPVTPGRPKGLPKSLVIAVAIIALLCVVAAAIIVVTQL